MPGSKAIDIHAHYFGEGYLQLFNEQSVRYATEYRSTKDGWYFKSPIASVGPLPSKFIDTKQRIVEMDQQGVAVQALSLTTPMVYWAEPEFSHRLARAWNDDAVAAHTAFPDRLVVLATLPMLDRDRAIDELNRVSKLRGVRGIYMGTNINNRARKANALYGEFEEIGMKSGSLLSRLCSHSPRPSAMPSLAVLIV